jgi:ketosteroid isomerase-like protein
MKKHTIYGLLVIFTLVFCLSIAPSATAASAEEEVLQVEMDFLKAYTTEDFESILSLYWHSSKTSTFHPANRPFLAQGWEESLENIWKSMSLFEGPTTATAHNLQVIFIGNDVAVLTGYENLINIDAETKDQTINNYRFTRVLQKIDGKWLIVHDHASRLPIE